jgi:hypothetical protein
MVMVGLVGFPVTDGFPVVLDGPDVLAVPIVTDPRLSPASEITRPVQPAITKDAGTARFQSAGSTVQPIHQGCHTAVDTARRQREIRDGEASP